MDSLDGKVFTVTIADLYADIQRLEAENAELRSCLKECHEAMTWEISGEPCGLQQGHKNARELLKKLGEVE